MDFRDSPEETAFRDRLRGLGVNATVRRNRGTSIDAACGQLRAGHEARVLVGQRTATVRRAPARIERTSRSPRRTIAPGQTTD